MNTKPFRPPHLPHLRPLHPTNEGGHHPITPHPDGRFFNVRPNLPGRKKPKRKKPPLKRKKRK